MSLAQKTIESRVLAMMEEFELSNITRDRLAEGDLCAFLAPYYGGQISIAVSDREEGLAYFVTYIAGPDDRYGDLPGILYSLDMTRADLAAVLREVRERNTDVALSSDPEYMAWLDQLDQQRAKELA